MNSYAHITANSPGQAVAYELDFNIIPTRKLHHNDVAIVLKWYQISVKK